MLSTIYLLKYNNYYNRKIKKESSLVNYAAYLIEATAREDINFNPNDGVDTELVIGNWSSSIPDYMLVVEDNTIISRWFVIEAARTRAGQFKLTLHRDVVVDNLSAVLSSTYFVEKSTLSNTNDIAIFNKEPYKFNSIKQSETLLKDETNCPWIVGYISSKDLQDDGETAVELKGNIDFYGSDEAVDYQYSNYKTYFDKFNTYNYKLNDEETIATIGGPSSFEAGINIFYGEVSGTPSTLSEGDVYSYYVHYSGNSKIRGTDKTYTNVRIKPLEYDSNKYCTAEYDNSYITKDDVYKRSYVYSRLFSPFHTHASDIKSFLTTYTLGENNPLIEYNNAAKCSLIEEEDGKIVKDTTSGKYYVISIGKAEEDLSYANSYVPVYTTTGALRVALEAVVTEANTDSRITIHKSSSPGIIREDEPIDGFYYRYTNKITYTVQLVELGVNTKMQYKIPSAIASQGVVPRNHLIDAPYDLFCMPYTNDIKVYQSGILKLTNNKILCMAAAMSIAKDLTGVGFVYDVQLLPYCPLPNNLIRPDGNIDFKNNSVGKIGTNLDEANENIFGYIFFANQSSFELTIEHEVNITDKKIQHQTDNWRFNSPNWSATYDFDATMNEGIEYIDIDCTYRPYNPYIHVCPRFNQNGYYGFNNNDAVGLICAGDFSLPVVTDQWKTYEYQNKNYQNIFDRGIQNQNTNYKLDSMERGVNAVTGIISGAVSGASGGTSGAGAIAGAVLGAGLSAVGAVGDAHLAKQRHKESVSYATDVFNYQIDNIKSLPNTLTKVSAFNINNRIFPFIEHFSCTQQEKDIFANLLKWQGSSIERIDTFQTFYDEDGGYFKARLIRADDSISEDFQLVAAIAEEIAKGVYY